MSLKSNALITVDELLNSMEMVRTDFSLPFFTIYNSSADASAASITITSTGITLVVTGGANAHSNTLTFAANATLTALITAIEALAKGWVVNRLASGSQASSDLFAASGSTLLVANIASFDGANGLYLEDLINKASSRVQTYCRRVFVQASYTEYYDGDNSYHIRLNQFPVISFTSLALYEYTSQSVLSTYSIHVDYEVYTDEGTVYMAGGFALGNKNYQAVYSAGYTTADMPEDIKDACAKLCKLAHNLKGKDGMSTERTGNYSYTREEGEIPADIKGMLNPYKRRDHA